MTRSPRPRILVVHPKQSVRVSMARELAACFSVETAAEAPPNLNPDTYAAVLVRIEPSQQVDGWDVMTPSAPDVPGTRGHTATSGTPKPMEDAAMEALFAMLWMNA